MKRIPWDGTGGLCEACGKPVRRGQFVNVYDDVGEVHADCDRPYARPKEPTPAPDDRGGFMTTFVLLGDPMLLYRVEDGPGDVVTAAAAPANPAPDAGGEAAA